MDNTSIGTNALVALFNDRSSAERAAQQLLRNGFRSDQVHVSSSDELTTNVASGNAGLSGTAHESSGGGIAGFFRNLFGEDTPEEDSRYYSGAVQSGKSAVVVHADDNTIDRAADILNESGAVNVEEDGSAYHGSSAVDRTQTEYRGERAVSDAATDVQSGTAIPVVREDINIGKRVVQRGGVRVYNRVSEQPVEKDIELQEEHVRVDRRKVDRPATEADLAAGQREVIEVNESSEEPVVEKVARVVEEVVVGKETRKRTEKVRDTVRRTDVEVEDSRTGGHTGGAAQGIDTDFETDFRSRYGSVSGAKYNDYAPAYQYGYTTASDQRYKGRAFSDVENDLRTDYLRNNPNSSWDRVKGAIEYGWEKVTGRR